MSAGREHLVLVAQLTVINADVPPGWRVVVVVSDDAGEFLGVSSNTSPEDTQRILCCASENKEFKGHGVEA